MEAPGAPPESEVNDEQGGTMLGRVRAVRPRLPAAERTRENLEPRFAALTALGIPWVEPADISNAVLWLASDESRYITGITLPIDAGQTIK
jgi:NAD(P)-dependent dehydrogenase (short-subunit alcohol dehydrogenase family)